MHLHCGNQRITVAVAVNLVDAENYPTYGLYDPAGRIIYLDAQTPKDERRITLVHELGHAFDGIAGKVDPNDPEASANRSSLIESQFSESLDRAGGILALHQLFGDADLNLDMDEKSADESNLVNDEETDYPTAVACPRCHREYASRVIRNGKPSFETKLSGFGLWRVLVCAPCERYSRWRQLCTHDGVPLPMTIVQPVLKAIP